MNLPAKLAQTRNLLRQGWDMWWGGSGGAGGSSTSILAWDASKGGTRLSSWFPPSTDFAALLSPHLLKSRSRDAFRNISWATRAVCLLRDHVVSTGISPMLTLPDAALRSRVHSLWAAWTENSDFSGRVHFYGQQAEAFQACLVDGECLALIRPGPTLQIQILSSEFLDYTRDNARDIVGGIQFDEQGRRQGFWLYEKSPAAPLIPISRFWPSEYVIHLFAPTQLGVERGSPWLAPVLLNLYELRSYLEASLIRARAGSLFCGFVRSADGTPFLVTDTGTTDFEPGSLARLRPGDEIQFSNPPDPSQGAATFVATQLRAISVGLSLPYELLAGDLSQISFASGREGLLAFQRSCDAIVQNLFAPVFCKPVWKWWTRIMVASGQLPEEILAAPVRWVGVPIPTLDSRMETQSTIQKVRAGLLSRAEAVRVTGLDVEALDDEIATDNARADKLGLILDSDPRKVTLQGLEQPSDAKVE